jgi:hypothetical protein
MSVDKVHHVRLALNAGIENWVLFSGGTFVVLKDVGITADIGRIAIELIRKHGEAEPGTSSADFMVTPLLYTDGWIVRGDADDIYVYVHPSEIATESPSDLQIGLYARNIRQKDADNPVVIHVNRS